MWKWDCLNQFMCVFIILRRWSDCDYITDWQSHQIKWSVMFDQSCVCLDFFFIFIIVNPDAYNKLASPTWITESGIISYMWLFRSSRSFWTLGICSCYPNVSSSIKHSLWFCQVRNVPGSTLLSEIVGLNLTLPITSPWNQRETLVKTRM